MYSFWFKKPYVATRSSVYLKPETCVFSCSFWIICGRAPRDTRHETRAHETRDTRRHENTRHQPCCGTECWRFVLWVKRRYLNWGWLDELHEAEHIHNPIRLEPHMIEYVAAGAIRLSRKRWRDSCPALPSTLITKTGVISRILQSSEL